jgi:hypothetical protein
MSDFPWGDLTPAQRRQIHEAHADAKTRASLAAAAANAVKPGQIWQDCDPRSYGRHLLVETIEEPAGRAPARAVVLLVGANGDVHGRERRTRIKLDRFRPTSNGYRLIRDVQEEL